MEGHALDEDGDHDEETCYPCLLAKEPVKNDCRCGNCCRRLIIEVLPQDAEREPRIKEKGKPILIPADLSGTGTEVLEGYLLNDPANGYACTFLDRATNLCSIYENQPYCLLRQ